MAKRPPPLMGLTEIGDYYGASRQLVYSWAQARDFPAPYVELSMGKVWRTEDVLAWGKAKGKKRAPAKAAA